MLKELREMFKGLKESTAMTTWIKKKSQQKEFF